MDPADVESELRRLASRVEALERRLGLAGAAPAAPPQAGPAAATAGSDVLPLLGRALLGLAGAYVLRALVEAGSVPARGGVATGILYAVMWLVWAARTPAARKLEAALHALTSVLVLAPLLWEATLRFHAIGTWTVALTLLGFTLFGLAISWRKNLLVVATIATLAGVGTAAALLAPTRDVVPFTTVFLVIAAAVEASACVEHWLSERWLAAAAADLSVLLATWLVTNERGLPQGYAPIPRAWLVGAQVALLAIYLGSTIVRTLFRRFTFTAFETMQCVAAFAISVGGGLRLSPAMPVVALACAAACYVVAFALLARGRNFYTYSTFGLMLAVAGSRILLPPGPAAAVWAALAVAGSWSGRVTLHVHGAVYLALALAAERQSGRGVPALVAVAACYFGARRGPLRIPLFAAATYAAAECVGGFAPDGLRLAVKLLIYGAALITLPRLRRTEEKADAAGAG